MSDRIAIYKIGETYPFGVIESSFCPMMGELLKVGDPSKSESFMVVDRTFSMIEPDGGPGSRVICNLFVEPTEVKVVASSQSEA